MRSVKAISHRNTEKRTRRKPSVNLRKVSKLSAVAGPWLIVFGLTVGLFWTMFTNGGPSNLARELKSEAIQATLKLGFKIEAVWVDGLQHSNKNDVLKAIGANRGAPILEFDTQQARNRLLDLPWVKEASVSLALPNKVHVNIKEREPIAIWQMNRELHVIDNGGDIIQGVEPAAFAKLPIMVGEGANKAAQDLFRLMADTPKIAQIMTAASYVGYRRWNIKLDNRIEINLPAKNVKNALQRLNRLQQEHEIFSKDILGIDLRIPDRLIVRVTDKKTSQSNQDTLKIRADRSS
jgi:cell division protein FtsQ